MRKFFFIFLSVFCLIITPFRQRSVYADEVELDLCATSAVLMEPVSKKVIYSKNPDQKLYPASMTKMMGLYLILEAIENKAISWEDTVTVSSYAASMGGTQIFLEVNEQMPLEDLFKAVAINSANDAIVALGEHLCSSNGNFVARMNQKAQEFGMKNTHFNNATGFDDEDHYTTAYDMALLGCHLVSFGQKILRFTSMEEGYVRENTDQPFWLVNTNKLLKYYEGLDGLKTGFTTKAGYNLTATAERNGVRLVSTVMHLDTIAHRSQDTTRLLDYGFSKLKAICVFDKEEIISTFEIDESLGKYLNVISDREIKIITDKSTDEQDLEIEATLEKTEAPYEKGEKVGFVTVKTPDGNCFRFDLFAANQVTKSTFLHYLANIIAQLFV